MFGMKFRLCVFCRRDCMESVVQQMGGGATLEEVMRVVEELSRIH